MKAREHTCLFRDSRGTISIVGVFATAIIIGVLFYLLGTGRTLRERQILNDAADSGAFATGVMHARGMNLVVLGNQTKVATATPVASLFAVIFGGAEVASAAAGRCYSSLGVDFRQCWDAVVITAFAIIPAVLQLLDGAVSTMRDIVGAADEIQEILKTELAIEASERAAELTTSFYSPVVVGAFLGETTRELPIEDARSMFDRLSYCMFMFPLGREITERAFDDAPILDPSNHSDAEQQSSNQLVPMCLIVTFVFPEVLHKRLSADLGDDEFQRRFFVAGRQLDDFGDQGVRVATWGHDPPADMLDAARDRLSQIGFAQTEFHFDTNGSDWITALVMSEAAALVTSGDRHRLHAGMFSNMRKHIDDLNGTNGIFDDAIQAPGATISCPPGLDAALCPENNDDPFPFTFGPDPSEPDKDDILELGLDLTAVNNIDLGASADFSANPLQFLTPEFTAVWFMNWKSRIKRFRMEPSGWADFESACGAELPGFTLCNVLRNDLETIEEAIVR